MCECTLRRVFNCEFIVFCCFLVVVVFIFIACSIFTYAMHHCPCTMSCNITVKLRHENLIFYKL